MDASPWSTLGYRPRGLLWSKPLGASGRRLSDIEAVVLTHAHFDHLGFAERARTDLGVPVWVHENDVPLTRNPRQYAHERPRLLYLATQFRAAPIVAQLVRNRALVAEASQGG